MKRQEIDVEELKKVFRLKDGKLERLRSYPSIKWVVVENNGSSNGYSQVRLNSTRIYYHTIVWLLTTGEDIPKGIQIDHINGNKTDNRFENLRLVSTRENQQNQKVHRKGKLVGCYFDKVRGKYRAHIWIDKKLMNLGRYATEEEAHKVYLIACQHIEEYVDNGSFRELIKK